MYSTPDTYCPIHPTPTTVMAAHLVALSTE
jgi:hypothetical protein